MQGRAEQHGLQLAHWRQSRDRRRLCGRETRDQARPRQQPPGPESDGAARRRRRLRIQGRTRSRFIRRARTRMSAAARPLSAFIGLAPEHSLPRRAPAISATASLKIFIYAEETVCAWAAKKIDRPVKWTSDRTEAFLSDAHGRDHVTHANLRSTRARSPACGASDRQSWRCSTTVGILRAGPMGTATSDNTPSAQYFVEVDAVYTNTTAMSTPIAAQGARRRRSWSSAW